MFMTELSHFKEDAYSVIECETGFDTVPAWYFYYLDIDAEIWHCYTHNAEGLPIEEVGSGLPATDDDINDFQGCLPREATRLGRARKCVIPPTRRDHA